LVDILVRRRQLKRVPRELVGDLLQPRDEHIALGLGEHARTAYGSRIGDAAADIHRRQTFIETYGGIKGPHHLVGDAGVAASPKFAHRNQSLLNSL